MTTADITAQLRNVAKALDVLTGKAGPVRRLYAVNFDGTECKTVAQLSAANRCSELKAAVSVLERHWQYSPELIVDAVRFTKGLQPGPASNHEGVAVVLTFDGFVESQITQAGGESPDDIHVTLGFFGNALRFSDQQRELFQHVCRRVARRFIPFNAKLNGITRFAGEETDPIVLNVDSPTIEKVRNYMLATLSDLGITTDTEHGFTPHCTLGYVDKNDPLPLQRWAPVDVTIRAIEVWFGRDRFGFPLGAADGEPYAMARAESKDVYMGPGSFPRRGRGTQRRKIIERARQFNIRDMEKKR